MKRALIVALAALIAMASLIPAAWAEPAQTAAPEALELGEPEAAVDKASGETQEYEVDFSSEHPLNGLFSSFTETFYIGNWDVSVAKLTLCFSTSPLIRVDVSDFTLTLNGYPFYSTRLQAGQGQVFELTVDMPIYALKDGLNQLTMDAYVRTNENDPCKEDISDASWITVMEDSFVRFEYEPVATILSVADAYEQFTSVDALTNEQSCVYVPANASDTELTAAGFALCGISSNADIDYDAVRLESLGEASLTDSKYAILLCEYANLPGAVSASLTAVQQAEVAENAVVVLYQPQKNCNVIVVTSQNQTALANAGRLMGNSNYMSQCLYTWRIVTPDEDVTFDWIADADSSVITADGTYLHGPFRQSVNYYISNGSNQMLAYGSSVDLVYRYSSNIDFENSLVTVYINDIPIGSKTLSAMNADSDSGRFVISDTLNVVGNFVMTVAFDLEIKDLPCTIRREDMPWAYISSESSINLKTSKIPFVLFDYYPAPFINNGKMDNVVVVLPNDVNSYDLDAFRMIMLTLGRYQRDNTGSYQVRRASNVGNIETSNVICIGSLPKNYIAQQLNDTMFFRFSPQGTTVISNEKTLIEPNYGALLGTGQLMYSPYSTGDNALLLVSGTTDENMLKAATSLGSEQNLWLLYGDGFITDNEDNFCYRFKEDNAQQQSLFERIFQNTQLTVLFAFIGLIVFAFILIIIVRLLRRSFRGRA